MTIDSTSQEFVTVRRIFSDDPASATQPDCENFGGVPFFPAGMTVPAMVEILLQTAPLSIHFLS